MGKFGLGKRNDGDEDSSRRALFSSRSKPKSPAPPSQNPYAQPSMPPDPYTQAKMNAGLYGSQNAPPPGLSRPGPQSGPPSNSTYGAMSPLPSQQSSYGRDSGYGPSSSSYNTDNKFAPSQGGYGGGGYGTDRFGKPNPYGAEPPGANPYADLAQPSGIARGPGGYGGLGRTNSNETTTTDANRDELFGGARERMQQRQQGSANGPPGYENNPAEGAEQETSYGAYGDRQLTAEEEEEEDVEATKQDIRFMKQQDVSSTRNALRMAAQAEETGRNTLARLGAQGERIHNTERNLDVAENQARIGEDKIKELKTLNRSMFAIHAKNPFTADSRREKREDQIMSRHQMERELRESSREAAFQSTQRMNQNFKGLDNAGAGAPRGKASLAERAKYQFEADSEDDQMEDEIEKNIDDLSGAAGRLNLLAKATGEEIEAQNGHLMRIADKSDKFDDRLHLQTERIKRIR